MLLLLGGVIYSANPPNKRFVYYLDQLSGGEKTMAGLALLFAVGLVKKNRFIILDEADAHLDDLNRQ